MVSKGARSHLTVSRSDQEVVNIWQGGVVKEDPAVWKQFSDSEGVNMLVMMTETEE